MASSPKNVTQTTKTEPWSGAMPYLMKTYGAADKLSDQGVPNYFPGSNVIEQSGATKDALSQMEAMARNPTGLLNNAQNVANNVLTGGAYDQKGQNTLKGLMGGVNLGTNAADKGVANFLAQTTGAQAPGDRTLQQGTQFQNAAMGNAQALANGNAVNPALQGFQNATGYTNAANGLITGQANQLANGSNPARDMLNATANGSMLNSNPYLNEAINTANRGLIDQFKTEIAPGIDSQFAGAGRMGSNAFAQARNKAESSLAGAMSNNANNIMMQNYQTERGNQLNAQNQIGNLYNSDVSNSMQANGQLAGMSDSQNANRLNALQGLGQTAQNDWSNSLNANQLLGSLSGAQNDARMNSANSLNNQYNANNATNLQGLGLQSDIYNSGVQNKLNNANLMMNAANSFTQNNQNQVAQQLGAASNAGAINDQRYGDANKLAQVGGARDTYADLVLQGDIARWDQEQNKQWDNVGRMASLLTSGGYNTATSTKPVYSNPMGQALGGAASLASIFGMLSERRFKTDIEYLYTTPGGHKVYSYRYIFDGHNDETRIGVMVDEVEAIQPEAINILSSGIKTVNYGTLH